MTGSEYLQRTFVTSGVEFQRFAEALDLNLRNSNWNSTVSAGHEASIAIRLVFFYASWNQEVKKRIMNHQALERATETLIQWMTQLTSGLVACLTFVSMVEVDSDEESVKLCIGEDYFVNKQGSSRTSPLPPSEFPCLGLVVRYPSSMDSSDLRYIPGIRSQLLVDSLFSRPVSGQSQTLLWKALQNVMDKIESEYNLSADSQSCSGAIRIFVAGDRSSVGKSSICLGLLGSLVRSGAYEPSELAYIKPATQSESTQLIQLWCERHGVACVPVGPLVYYRGFTRAYLAGETPSSPELLQSCASAVDRLARGKKVVLVDGVGFPAVGSICGTDNPRVALACSYPTSDGAQHSEVTTIRSPMGVVLVGGPGVGAAVDAFNLNAAYFERYHVPVLGAIFNKLEKTGFYSLESCRKEITSYFDQYGQGHRAFGFVPLFPSISGDKSVDHVDEYILLFQQHVDVQAILDAAKIVKDSPLSITTSQTARKYAPPQKRYKLESPQVAHLNSLPIRSRKDIEKAAIDAGAAPSA